MWCELSLLRNVEQVKAQCLSHLALKVKSIRLGLNLNAWNQAGLGSASEAVSSSKIFFFRAKEHDLDMKEKFSHPEIHVVRVCWESYWRIGTSLWDVGKIKAIARTIQDLFLMHNTFNFLLKTYTCFLDFGVLTFHLIL